MICPFCEINDLKTRILKKKKFVFVALSNPRLVPGHLLVIPKRHVEKPTELNSEERKELFDTVIKYQNKITEAFSGCDIRQHYRPFIEQSKTKVNHVHFHLHPRELGDELYQKSQKFEGEIFKELTKKEAEKFSKLYK